MIIKIVRRKTDNKKDTTMSQIYDNVSTVVPVTEYNKNGINYTKEICICFHNGGSLGNLQDAQEYNYEKIKDNIEFFLMNDNGKTIERFYMKPKSQIESY